MLDTDRFANSEVFIYAYLEPGSDEVVYVGRSYDLRTRHGAHRQKSPWWRADLEVAVVDVAHSWEQAVRMEAVAIRQLRPARNIQHNRQGAAE